MDDSSSVYISPEKNFPRNKEATEVQHIELSASCSISNDDNDSIKDFHFLNSPSSENYSNMLQETAKCITIQPKSVSFDEKETRTERAKHNEQIHFNQKQLEHICALCLKSYKGKNLKLIHMKTCASKSQFSTKHLLDDIHLEDRQIEEREDRRLFSAPALPSKLTASCNLPKFVTGDEGDLQIALALSKSLLETEQIRYIHGDWDKSSKAPFFNFQEDTKKSLQHFRFTSDKLPTESFSMKLKKRKINSSTTLQLSNPEIRNRILTKNLAEILMEDGSVENGNDILSWRCSEKIKRVVQRNNCLQKYHFVENKLWNFATFWNQLMSNYLFEDEFIVKDYDEEKSSELFGYLIKNIEIESIYKQNNANTNFSKKVTLDNDHFTAIRKTSKESKNSKSLKYCGEAKIEENTKVLYEEEANEDHEYLNILSNLINICSLNEDIREFLKFFALENEKNIQINQTNIFDLERVPNSQHEQQKFLNSEGFCSEQIIFKPNGNLLNDNVQKFNFDNQINGNKETEKISSSLMRQEEVISSSNKRRHAVSALSCKPIQLLEVECGNIKPRNLRKWKTNNLLTEIIRVNEFEKSNSGILNLEDIAVISDSIDTELFMSSNNTNDFKTSRESIATSYTIGTFSNDKATICVPLHNDLIMKQRIDYKFTDFYDKNRRIQTFNANYGYEENIVTKDSSGKLEYCNREIRPTSAKCMDNSKASVDYSIMETSQLKGELRKYGLKIQEPRKAMQLLNHIRDELEPVKSKSHEISLANTRSCSSNTRILEETHSFELLRNESLRHGLSVKDWTLSNKTMIQGETESDINFKTVEVLNEDRRHLNGQNIFANFLTSNSEILKKIFKYQPLELNVIRMYLKDQGLRWSTNSLMEYLDQQSVTFFTDSNKEKEI